VYCVEYGEIVWYMAVNVFVCDSKSVSVCSWLECDCVTCTVLCERECVCVCVLVECGQCSVFWVW
jgi:hypothetical protein